MPSCPWAPSRWCCTGLHPQAQTSGPPGVKMSLHKINLLSHFAVVYLGGNLLDHVGRCGRRRRRATATSLHLGQLVKTQDTSKPTLVIKTKHTDTNQSTLVHFTKTKSLKKKTQDIVFWGKRNHAVKTKLKTNLKGVELVVNFVVVSLQIASLCLILLQY